MRNTCEYRLLEGKKGLKDLLNKSLNSLTKGGEIGVIGSTGKPPLILEKEIQKWHNERINQKIKLKALVFATTSGKKRIKDYKRMDFVRAKLFPEGSELQSTIFMFENKLAIILWFGLQPYIIELKKEKLNQKFLQKMNFLWKKR